MLKTVSHLGMCSPNTALDILFHRNDPRLVEGRHGHPNAFKTSRKPDIVIVSLRAAKRVSSRENTCDTWDYISKAATANAPLGAFYPFYILAASEKKRRVNIDPDSLEIPGPAKMPPPVPPQNNVNALLNSNKRPVSSGAQPFSPATKRQKIDGG